ncbi:MAG: RnfABCDGE type electron transport complex subunit C [Firmicutes bacterium]|nr:RnfABCDGE type electron transport complex subunit C [Bacillota bacterium]
MSGLKIPKYKEMSMKHKLNVYSKPKYVYIPLISSNDENITVLVNIGDYVFKGSQIGRRKGNFKTPIFSSVSGSVIGFEKRTISSGKSVKCVVIENDFKEKIEKGFKQVKKLNNITKEEFVETIENCGIVGLGGAGFPTYVKYSTHQKIHTLIVNAVECEPYITADYFIIKEKCEEILEMIDAILEINNIDNCIIAIKTTNKSLMTIFNKYIGTYLKIKVVLVPNIYPMGWERKLIKEVTGITYEKIPSEKGIIVNNVSTIYAMYQALKLNKPMIERIVTFSGFGLKKPQNVLVKVGTPVDEVINYIGGSYKTKKLVMIAGGPMMGTKVDDLVITPEVNSVLIMEDDFECDVQECLRCGKCINVCPANICPVLIKDNIDDTSALKSMNVDKCISCGLCSYICPAKINVREYVSIAKEKVGK